jgi:very-short-patch-repair endonuclease
MISRLPTSDHGIPLYCRALRIPEPEREVRFHPVRRWRFDYAWPDQRIALEIDGGVWVGGRHSGGAGQVKDMEKMNHAAALGWRVFRCEPKPASVRAVLELVSSAIGAKEAM